MFLLLDLTNLSPSFLTVEQITFSCTWAGSDNQSIDWQLLGATILTKLRNEKGSRILIELLFLAKPILGKKKKVFFTVSLLQEFSRNPFRKLLHQKKRKLPFENYIIWTHILLFYITITIFPFLHDILIANAFSKYHITLHPVIDHVMAVQQNLNILLSFLST